MEPLSMAEWRLIGAMCDLGQELTRKEQRWKKEQDVREGQGRDQ